MAGLGLAWLMGIWGCLQFWLWRGGGVEVGIMLLDGVRMGDPCPRRKHVCLW